MTNEDGANVQSTSLTISAESLADASLESQVRSWIGDGPNEAITAGQIVAVVGEDQLAQAAESLESDSVSSAELVACPVVEEPGAHRPGHALPFSSACRGRAPGPDI
ncbi:YidB family protein [Streptomyces sp. NRRL S-448]|uniref:YidB family protein n=1 Tax=Streptomyces sp. NRRL S-448 TaxID=1463907 RepID=UPI000A4483B5